MKKSLAILVLSCDAYSDLWEPFFKLFIKFWPDCSFPVYLSTETKSFPAFPVNYLYSNGTWSEMLAYAVENIPEERIILMQEDFFLVKRVQHQRILDYNSLLDHVGFDCLRLYPAITAHLKNIDTKNDIGTIDKLKEEFIVSCQASIWKKEVLLAIISGKESGWEFERNGSERAKSLPYTFGSIVPHTPWDRLDEGQYPITYIFLTAVTRGKFTSRAAQWCKRNNIEIDLKKRNRLTEWDNFYFAKATHWQQHVMDFINSRMIRWFKIDLRYSDT